MNRIGILCPGIAVILSVLVLSACNNAKKPASTDIVVAPEQLDIKTTENIHALIDFATSNDSTVSDSIVLPFANQVRLVYSKSKYAPVWSSMGSWKPLADSLFRFIQAGKLYGLFPQDYHLAALDSIRQSFDADSASKTSRKDAAIWAKADVLLSDAYVHIVRDLKLGRLPADSVTMRQDSALSDEFYWERMAISLRNNSLSLVFNSLEPRHEGYRSLKAAIPQFLDSSDNRIFTKVPFPKNAPDFKKILQTRLYEGGFLAQDTIQLDSLTLAEAVKRFQARNRIVVDGKAGDGTVRALNISDSDRFVRIAITMDRYKLLPEKMPDRYVWVNLPGYYMKLLHGDTLKLQSKIICGKPLTRTPLLTSALSEIITYPQWTVPTSIIVKEILPAVKKDPGYLARKGFSLVDSKGDEVDPYTVEWTKYNKGIPYKVVQGSGDDNALGILKFNFPNKYAVYLHDTNQRYLFARDARALSHGCVRIQEWDKLALDIIQYDNFQKPSKKAQAVEDSLNTWLVRKEKHSIGIRNRLPLYIRYFTCEADGNGIAFYDDIYGEDKWIREKYFARK